MSRRFYARGKILLTSEYVVLHGAKALAVPLKLGQSLSRIKKNKTGVLSWKAFHDGLNWFEASIQVSDLSIIQSSSKEKAQTLVKLLESCIQLNPDFIDELAAWDVKTELEFNPDYGFGSSSTLISLLAQWAAVDPLQLHSLVSNGSGYDLACASANTAITYQLIEGKPKINSINFKPAYAGKLWLVYQGKKQNSELSVSSFLAKRFNNEAELTFFTNLTNDIIKSQTLAEFGALISSHEKQISELLSVIPVGREIFNDFDGYSKSLGAWGGDFAFLASERDASYVEDYLRSHQFDIFFPYNELAIL